MNKDIIRNAYAIIEAREFFQNVINKETILELYTELDYVYDLLESLDIVSRYSGIEILKDFDVIKIYDDFFIEFEGLPSARQNLIKDNNGKYSIKINIESIILEVHKVFHNV